MSPNMTDLKTSTSIFYKYKKGLYLPVIKTLICRYKLVDSLRASPVKQFHLKGLVNAQNHIQAPPNDTSDWHRFAQDYVITKFIH